MGLSYLEKKCTSAVPIPQASSQWRKTLSVPESAWGRILLFIDPFSLVKGSNFDAWEGMPMKRDQTWEENKELTLRQVLRNLDYTRFQNVLLFVKTDPVHQDQMMLVSCKNVAISLLCNYCVSDSLSEDCQFVVFCWCYTGLCKLKNGSSTNPTYISKYLLLFPRMSYPLLALYLFTVPSWRKFCFHLSNECFIPLLISRLFVFLFLQKEIFPFFRRKQAW